MTEQDLLQVGDFVRVILDAMPLPVFIVDDDVKIVAFNQAASKMLDDDSKTILRTRAGEVLDCVHSRESAEGCGRAAACRDCIVRNAVTMSLRDHKMVRQKARMELVEDGSKTAEIFLLVTTAPFGYQGKTFVLLILEDISELIALKRILPICAHCKRIRNDDQYWHSVERYFKDCMDVDFSHGLCPECMKKYYPEFCEGDQP